MKSSQVYFVVEMSTFVQFSLNWYREKWEREKKMINQCKEFIFTLYMTVVMKVIWDFFWVIFCFDKETETNLTPSATNHDWWEIFTGKPGPWKKISCTYKCGAAKQVSVSSIHGGEYRRIPHHFPLHAYQSIFPVLPNGDNTVNDDVSYTLYVRTFCMYACYPRWFYDEKNTSS